jgi:hypothetical protein
MDVVEFVVEVPLDDVCQYHVILAGADAPE